jgi:hypothetical protein
MTLRCVIPLNSCSYRGVQTRDATAPVAGSAAGQKLPGGSQCHGECEPIASHQNIAKSVSHIESSTITSTYDCQTHMAGDTVISESISITPDITGKFFYYNSRYISQQQPCERRGEIDGIVLLAVLLRAQLYPTLAVKRLNGFMKTRGCSPSGRRGRPPDAVVF